MVTSNRRLGHLRCLKTVPLKTLVRLASSTPSAGDVCYRRPGESRKLGDLCERGKALSIWEIFFGRKQKESKEMNVRITSRLISRCCEGGHKNCRKRKGQRMTFNSEEPFDTFIVFNCVQLKA